MSSVTSKSPLPYTQELPVKELPVKGPTPFGDELDAGFRQRAVYEDPLDDVDPALLKRLVRKQDLVLVPLLWTTYTISFIDRAAIGNAKVLGFAKDTHLEGNQYNIGLSVFFVAYVCFQIPNNLMLKAVGARVWLTFLLISSGLITLSSAFVSNFGGFVTVRFLLGVVEGGVISGFAQLLTLFYDRDQITSRAAWYLIAPTTSGAFGGLLAYGLAQIKPTGVLKNWSYIFLVEGGLSILLGLIGAMIYPSAGPGSVWWLTQEEKELATRRMQASARSATIERSTPKLVKRAFNPLTFLNGVGYISAAFSVQSLSIFLPQILNDLGYTPLGSNLAAVWPNLVGSVVYTLIVLGSRRTGVRGPWSMFGFALSMVGFVLLVYTGSERVNYGGTFIASMGVAVQGSLLIGWSASNSAPFCTRAVAVAIPPSMGHLGAIASTWAYEASGEPHFTMANALNIGSCALGVAASAAATAWVAYENRARRQGRRDHRLHTSWEEVGLLGSDHPNYRLLF